MLLFVQVFYFQFGQFVFLFFFTNSCSICSRRLASIRFVMVSSASMDEWFFFKRGENLSNDGAFGIISLNSLCCGVMLNLLSILGDSSSPIGVLS